MTSELAGLRDGARNNGNGNGNGKHKHGQQKEKPQVHSVFKYSCRFGGPLHESIMFGSEPFFLTYSDASGRLGLVRQIEENNRILAPPSIEEYPYEPVEFSSKREIKDYEGLALNETIDSLYQKVKLVSEFIHRPRRRSHNLDHCRHHLDILPGSVSDNTLL